jgi:hypothetical protein
MLETIKKYLKTIPIEIRERTITLLDYDYAKEFPDVIKRHARMYLSSYKVPLYFFNDFDFSYFVVFFFNNTKKKSHDLLYDSKFLDFKDDNDIDYDFSEFEKECASNYVVALYTFLFEAENYKKLMKDHIDFSNYPNDIKAAFKVLEKKIEAMK